MTCCQACKINLKKIKRNRRRKKSKHPRHLNNLWPILVLSPLISFVLRLNPTRVDSRSQDSPTHHKLALNLRHQHQREREKETLADTCHPGSTANWGRQLDHLSRLSPLESLHKNWHCIFLLFWSKYRHSSAFDYFCSTCRGKLNLLRHQVYPNARPSMVVSSVSMRVPPQQKKTTRAFYHLRKATLGRQSKKCSLPLSNQKTTTVFHNRHKTTVRNPAKSKICRVKSVSLKKLFITYLHLEIPT